MNSDTNRHRGDQRLLLVILGVVIGAAILMLLLTRNPTWLIWGAVVAIALFAGAAIATRAPR